MDNYSLFSFGFGENLTEGAAESEEVTSRNITDVRVIFTPGKRFRQALESAEFKKESLN